MESVTIGVDDIENIVLVLDANDAIRGLDHVSRMAYRILKIAEETGEVCEALVGMLGQNPLKGQCRTDDEVAEELCDVALTAIVALASLKPNTWPTILEREIASVIISYGKIGVQ